jgi:hypothetical protein
MLLLLPDAFLFLSFCSGGKYRSAYGLNRCMRHLRQAQWANGMTAKWFKINQIKEVGWDYLALAGR